MSGFAEIPNTQFSGVLGNRLEALRGLGLDEWMLDGAERIAWETLEEFSEDGGCPAPVRDHFRVSAQGSPGVCDAQHRGGRVLKTMDVTITPETELARRFLERTGGITPVMPSAAPDGNYRYVIVPEEVADVCVGLLRAEALRCYDEAFHYRPRPSLKEQSEKLRRYRRLDQMARDLAVAKKVEGQ